MTRRALGARSAAGTGIATGMAPDHHRLAPAPPPVSFLLTYLGNASHPRLFFTGLRWVGTAKRPPPPSARVPRWPGTSPPRSSRLGSSALMAWLFRPEDASGIEPWEGAQASGRGPASPELSFFGRKREINVLNATCVHVYLEATNYWLQLGCMDRHMDENRARLCASVRIHPLRKWDAKFSNFQGSELLGLQ